MGLVTGAFIGGIVKTIGAVASAVTSEPVVSAIKYTAKAATPLILKSISDSCHSDNKFNYDIARDIETKEQVALMNKFMGNEICVVPYDILNAVNAISNAINKLLYDLGEDNAYVDEILITYFIQQFKVPQKYADVVFRILEDNYALENQCIRDGVKIINNTAKKKNLETIGAKELIKQKKQGLIDDEYLNRACQEVLMIE